MKRKNITSRLNLLYLLTLTPLILFGIYKNTIDVYNKGNISFVLSLKPLAIIFMSLTGSIIGSFLKSCKTNKKIDLEFLYKSRVTLLESLILSMILPIKTSPYLVFIVTLIFSIVNTKKLNKVALMYLIIFIINQIFGLNVFENTYMLNSSLKLNWIDLLFGWGNGGICSTSVILIVLGLLILSFNKLYKKEIAFGSILTFTILSITINMLSANYGEIFKIIFGYHALFTFVFIAPFLYYSAYTVKGQILSGIVLGIMSYFLILLIPYAGVFIAVLLINILTDIFDRIFIIK